MAFGNGSFLHGVVLLRLLNKLKLAQMVTGHSGWFEGGGADRFVGVRGRLRLRSCSIDLGSQLPLFAGGFHGREAVVDGSEEGLSWLLVGDH